MKRFVNYLVVMIVVIAGVFALDNTEVKAADSGKFSDYASTGLKYSYYNNVLTISKDNESSYTGILSYKIANLSLSSNPKKVVINSGVTKISGDVFAYNSTVEELIIPDSVTSISTSAFKENSKLKKITFAHRDLNNLEIVSGNQTNTLKSNGEFVLTNVVDSDSVTKIAAAKKLCSLVRKDNSTSFVAVRPGKDNVGGWFIRDSATRYPVDSIKTDCNSGISLKFNKSATVKVTVSFPSYSSDYIGNSNLELDYDDTVIAVTKKAEEKDTWKTTFTYLIESKNIKKNTDLVFKATDGSGTSKTINVQVDDNYKSAEEILSDTNSPIFLKLNGNKSINIDARIFPNDATISNSASQKFIWKIETYGGGSYVTLNESTGKVTANSNSWTTPYNEPVEISAEANDGSKVKRTWKVYVIDAETTSIGFQHQSIEMPIGGKETLEQQVQVEPSLAPRAWRIFDWTSSKPDIVKVDNDGNIEALNEGTATITATTKDGSNLSASCTVTVKKVSVNEIVLSNSSVTLQKGNGTTITATVEPDNAANKSVNWSSSNTAVATVDNAGNVSAVAKGTATITATAADGSGISASCEVTVTDPEDNQNPDNNKPDNNNPDKPDYNPNAEDVTKKFTDVPAGKWYSKPDGPIAYVVSRGIMSGVGDGSQFDPEGECTREMFVTILYNAEGKPGPGPSNPFTDVQDGKWYTNAITWAVANNVTKGTSDTTFGLGGKVTREQLAQFLMNYAVTKGYDTSAAADLSVFPDGNKISGWAYNAISWANANGILNGKGKNGTNYLDPKGNATRAEVAAMIMNFQKAFMN